MLLLPTVNAPDQPALQGSWRYATSPLETVRRVADEMAELQAAVLAGELKSPVHL